MRYILIILLRALQERKRHPANQNNKYSYISCPSHPFLPLRPRDRPPNLLALQDHNPKRVPIPLTYLDQHALVLERLLPAIAIDALGPDLLPDAPPLLAQHVRQLVLHNAVQKAALGVAVEERDDAGAALGGGERVVVGELACEEEVGVHGFEDGAAAAGADGGRRDMDVFDLARLRDRDGEAFRVADAAGDALDEVREGLGVGEGDEAAHAGVGEACWEGGKKGG